MPYDEDIRKRLWRFVEICAHGDGCRECCWPWTGELTNKGYGRFKIYMGRTHMGKLHYLRFSPHRVALELALGHYLGKSYACHTCDNPPCCNACHLYEGSAKSNMEDRSLRNRHQAPACAEHGMAKLQEWQAKEIRFLASLGLFYAHEIAAEYGISRATVGDIAYGRSWYHLDYRLPIRWKPRGNLTDDDAEEEAA